MAKGVGRCDYTEDLEMGASPGGPNNHRVLIRGTKEESEPEGRQSDNRAEVDSCTLRIEEGAASRQVQAASRSRKRQENRFSFRASGRSQPCQ